jgi:hypothetical protein
MLGPTLEVALPQDEEGLSSGAGTKSFSLGGRARTRSSGKAAGGKWSSCLGDSLPLNRYSPYTKVQGRRKSPSEPSVEQPPCGAAPPIASPTAGVAASMENMSLTWPVSARTRSHTNPRLNRRPRQLDALDVMDTLSADLLMLVPKSAHVPRLKATKVVGRRPGLRLKPLPPDACPNAGLLGLAGLDDM